MTNFRSTFPFKHAAVVAAAYGRTLEQSSGGIWVLNREGNEYAAFIRDDGSVQPYTDDGIQYTKADHEVVMAVRAVLPLHSS